MNDARAMLLNTFEISMDDSSVLIPFDRIRISIAYEVPGVQNIVELIADEARSPYTAITAFEQRWKSGCSSASAGTSNHNNNPRNDSLPGAAAIAEPRFDNLAKLFSRLHNYSRDASLQPDPRTRRIQVPFGRRPLRGIKPRIPSMS